MSNLELVKQIQAAVDKAEEEHGCIFFNDTNITLLRNTIATLNYVSYQFLKERIGECTKTEGFEIKLDTDGDINIIDDTSGLIIYHSVDMTSCNVYQTLDMTLTNEHAKIKAGCDLVTLCTKINEMYRGTVDAAVDASLMGLTSNNLVVGKF